MTLQELTQLEDGRTNVLIQYEYSNLAVCGYRSENYGYFNLTLNEDFDVMATETIETFSIHALDDNGAYMEYLPENYVDKTGKMIYFVGNVQSGQIGSYFIQNSKVIIREPLY